MVHTQSAWCIWPWFHAPIELQLFKAKLWTNVKNRLHVRWSVLLRALCLRRPSLESLSDPLIPKGNIELGDVKMTVRYWINTLKGPPSATFKWTWDFSIVLQSDKQSHFGGMHNSITERRVLKMTIICIGLQLSLSINSFWDTYPKQLITTLGYVKTLKDNNAKLKASSRSVDLPVGLQQSNSLKDRQNSTLGKADTNMIFTHR